VEQELQELLEQIQREGVAKAEAEAKTILDRARGEADRIRADAQKAADELRARAERDSAAFSERARASLEQAARDVVLSTGNALSAALREIVLRDTREALTPETLRPIIERLVVAHFQASGAGGAEVLLGPDAAARLADQLMQRFAGALRGGLQVRAETGIRGGFKVVVSGESVQHDLTDAAIADALCELVRPRIAEIVRQAMARS
jgi:V/A-type H+-transporting ATPase subunit E